MSFRFISSYIRYYFTASNGKGHGIHSPFVYDFIIHVLNDKRKFYAYDKIERLRTKLLGDKTALEIEDFGAGSLQGNHKQRTVFSIAGSAAKPKKLGQLLFRIVDHYQPATILELGTSLGLSSAYLSMANPAAKLITCEGAPALASAARENFNRLDIRNIEIVSGNFDDTLAAVLHQHPKIDLAFIDGNHRKEPTLRYYEQLLNQRHLPQVIIFDDIHWSTEMEEAWTAIKTHPQTMLSIDLFFMGLVFFSNDFKVEQHFNIRF